MIDIIELTFGKKCLDQRLVSDATLDKTRVWVQVCAVAAAQIIKDSDPMTLFNQFVG